jgi:hypothetical protein
LILYLYKLSLVVGKIHFKEMKKFIYFLIFFLAFQKSSFGAIQYQIANLTDVSVSYTPGVDSGDLTDTQAMCVRIKKTGGDMGAPNNYKVTATSGNATGSTFRVYDSISEYINYDVTWYDTGDQTGSSFNLDSGVQSGTITGASTNNKCTGISNASFSVVFTEANLDAGTSGTYTDTLTIVIGPV